MSQFSIALRMQRRATIGWSIGVGSYLLLMGLVYGAFGGGEALEELAESYPEEMLGAFTDDIASIQGFLEAEAGTFLPIVFGIFLVMTATRRFAGAEETGLLDHLLARPITRSTYYWQSLLSIATSFSIIIAIGTLAAMAGFIGEADGKDFAAIVGIMIEQWLLGLAFLGLGGLVGTVFHRRAIANALGAGIVVVFFFLDFAARTVEKIDWLGYLTPIGYRSRTELFWGDVDPGFFPVVLIMAAATSILGWLAFKRKDLY